MLFNNYILIIYNNIFIKTSMNIKQIKKITNKIDFICIGACHNDNILKLKEQVKLYRTNPVILEKQIGGVSSNIANNLTIFSKKIKIFTLLLLKNQKKHLKKNKIKYYNISNVKNDNSYTAIIDNKGKLVIGLASNETYEKIKSINYNKIDKNITKYTCMILDLCFNYTLTQKIINYYYKKNIKIMIPGTSLFKIYKIKKSLKMISALCLNEDEIFKLTNKKNINKSINYIINKNPDICLVITRGNKHAIMIKNKIKYIGNIPKVNVKNENGAGDAFTSMFFLCISANIMPKITLALSITLGCLNVMDYKFENLIDYNKKFVNIYKKIKIHDKKFH